MLPRMTLFFLSFGALSCRPPNATPVNVQVAYVSPDHLDLGALPERLTRLPLEVGTIVDHRATDHDELGGWVDAEGARSITTSGHLINHLIRVGITKELAEAGVTFQPGAAYRLDAEIAQLRILKDAAITAELELVVHLVRDEQVVLSKPVKGSAKLDPAGAPEDIVNAAIGTALHEALSKLVRSDEFIRAFPA